MSDQLGVGAAVLTGDGEFKQATYRQVEDTFKVMCASIDPSPVPSFKGVPATAQADRLRECAGRNRVRLEEGCP